LFLAVVVVELVVVVVTVPLLVAIMYLETVEQGLPTHLVGHLLLMLEVAVVVQLTL
jgi:hypothetical protein